MFRKKVVEKIKTFENRAVYEMMWSIVELGNMAHAQCMLDI
jgi:hypothetical protein